MTTEEFELEFGRLEASMPPFMGDRERRAESAWDLLKDFDVRDLEEARRLMVKTRDSKFCPDLHEIYEACQEVAKGRDSKTPSRPHPPKRHECAAPAAEGEALRSLRVLFPYEAAHITCSETIKAVCGSCGKAHLDTSVLSEFVALLSEDDRKQTTNWNLNWKGRLLCDACAKRQK